MIVLLVIMFSCSGCSSISRPGTINSINAVANNSAGTKSKNNTGKRDYINIKYLFRVRYPAQWGEAIESETQDGALLYYKDGNDVRVFADKAEKGYLENQKVQSEDEGKEADSFTSDDGLKGIIITGSSKGKKLMHVIYVSNSTHYDFYALVTEKFNKDNENVFKEISKSIKTLSR